MIAIRPPVLFFLAAGLSFGALISSVIEPATLRMPKDGDIIQIQNEIFLVFDSTLYEFADPSRSLPFWNVSWSDVDRRWIKSRLSEKGGWRGWTVRGGLGPWPRCVNTPVEHVQRLLSGEFAKHGCEGLKAVLPPQ